MRHLRTGRHYRAKLRCARKGHEYQQLMVSPYQRCLRCGHVPKSAHRRAVAPL